MPYGGRAHTFREMRMVDGWLSPSRLAALPPEIARPRYDRTKLQAGIVHLGIGAFHRAHQAVVIDTLLQSRMGPWGIVGVSLRHGAVRDRSLRGRVAAAAQVILSD